MLWVCVPQLAAAQANFDRLDPGLDWVVGTIEFEGNAHFSSGDLKKKILTRERSRLRPWRARPYFDPAMIERDLERLTRFYEAEGYFLAHFDLDWSQTEENGRAVVDLRIEILEGPRARVSSVEIETVSTARPTAVPLPEIAIVEGEPFLELDYQAAQIGLRRAYLNRGYAHVEVERSARVSVDRLEVDVLYRVDPGREARFGSTQVTGLVDVDPEVVLRELQYASGDAFSLERIEESTRRLKALKLFSLVSIDWDPDPSEDDLVPIRIAVRERSPREIALSVGYSTEEEARVRGRWRHRNWLGGARTLTLRAKYSSIVRGADIIFAQPHFPSPRNRGLATVSFFQQEERTFSRDAVQGTPALEFEISKNLIMNFGVRIETTRVRDIESPLRRAIGGVRNEGLLIGPTFFLRWSPVDSLVAPTHGRILTIRGEQAGPSWGSTYDYYKFVAEYAEYHRLTDWLVLAGRIKVGLADAIGADEKLPIFERLYSGGDNSVRGYERNQLGPTLRSGGPLGGKTLIESSFEARFSVWKQLGLVGFFDMGQVRLDRFDLVPDNLRYSAGSGLTYDTPAGPLSLFAGFPINKQRGEPDWQLHFSVGYFF